MSECKIWNKATDDDGYGRVLFEGKNRKAHRIIYTQKVGAIPEGFEIDHLCRNRACVNVEHLEAVTQKENKRRAAQAIWDARDGKCLRGHPANRVTIKRNTNYRRCLDCNNESIARKKIRSGK